MIKTISGDTLELNVAAGHTGSDGFNLQKKSIVAVYIPADWDGGDITVQSSITYPEESWKNVIDSDGTAITLTSVTPDSLIVMAANELQAMMQLKNIRFLAASGVAAKRILTVSFKEV